MKDDKVIDVDPGTEVLIDEREIAVRIAEACCDIKRKPGADLDTALAEIDEAVPHMSVRFRRAAVRVIGYIERQLRAGRPQ